LLSTSNSDFNSTRRSHINWIQASVWN